MERGQGCYKTDISFIIEEEPLVKSFKCSFEEISITSNVLFHTHKSKKAVDARNSFFAFMIFESSLKNNF